MFDFRRHLSWLPVIMAILLMIATASAERPQRDVASLGNSASALAADEPITPIPAAQEDPRKVALGELLFHDRRLSHGDARSCATCHDTSTNGASANRHDTAMDGSDLTFNTNTVFNAALSFRLNWEGNSPTLDDQIVSSLERWNVMNTTVDEVVRKLSADSEMVRKFDAAYGNGPDRDSLLDAIATYERSLVTPGSRFDRWLMGDTDALSPEEVKGYRLFSSAGCVSCHQGVNVGGNLFEPHGVFSPVGSPNPPILRVPSLRNVATTPPYFHDGSAPTLGDAVRIMGRSQLGRNLSDDEIHSIVAFLGTLTGEYRGLPIRAASAGGTP